MSTTLPAQTRIENIHLHVHSLDASLQFYQGLLGLKETRREGTTVYLSASGNEPAVIVLTEQPTAKRRSRRSPGLFHVAILYPNKKELARIFMRLYQHGYKFQGFSDHGVSEALYLADPEGNGIELYADRPRGEWQYHNGELAMVSEPLNLDNLVSELEEKDAEWPGMHPETRIGHVHLQVSAIPKAEQFYHRLLGFDVTQRSYPGALFVAAGGYHHHLGLNIWNSGGSPPAGPGTLGLASFRINVSDISTLEALAQQLAGNSVKVERQNGMLRVQDFDGIAVEVTAI